MNPFKYLYCFLTPNCLALTKIINTSTRSCVVKVQDYKGNESVVKIRDHVAKEYSKNEAYVLKELNHPNILKCFEIFSEEKYIALLLECVDGESLIDRLLKRGRLPEPIVKEIGFQLFSTLVYLRSKKLSHLDLKPDNIMFNFRKKELKLLDFEFATYCDEEETLTKIVGTLEYRAPEVQRGKYFGPKADIWSLGITLYLLLVGEFPFLPNSTGRWSRIKSYLGSSKNKNEFEIGDIPAEISPSREFKNLMLGMIRIPVEDRMSLVQCVSHPWIKEDPNIRRFTIS